MTGLSIEAHDAVNIIGVKDISQLFSEIIGWINNSLDLLENDIILYLPILDVNGALIYLVLSVGYQALIL
mgnify:CR=1 FL=1